MKKIPFWRFNNTQKPNNKHLLTKSMKVSTFLMFCCSLSMMANNGMSQNAPVTINKSNTKLEVILNEIESQTDYMFIYRNDVNVNATKNIKAENKPVSEVLNLLLGDEVSYQMEGNHIILSSVSNQAANETVTGFVRDSSGEPLIGVTVSVKNTAQGTITDLDGKFTLSAKPGDVLVVSYIGFTSKEVVVKDKRELHITLKEDVKTLEEVVVVGYGIQKKSNVTGSISSVKSSDIENRSITEVNRAFQGKVAGVQLVSSSSAPGASSSIRIRGYSSNSTSDPLYVVDGVRMPNISEIEPSDIESMEILKDAASAAIYGAEAGNGVILITTKKGKQGKGTISYNFQYALQSLQHKPQVMNPEQYLDYMVTSKALTKEKAQTWDGVTRTDWADVLFETSGMAKHNLSFRGGGDRSSIYASINYLDDNGIVVGKKDTYKMLNGSLNASYKIKDWLKISWDNAISYYTKQNVSENSEWSSVLRSAYTLDPLTPVTVTVDQMTGQMKNLYDAGKKLINDGNGNYYAISDFNVGGNDMNPFIMMDSGYTKNYGYSARGNASLDLTPIKGLVITSRLGYYLRSNNRYLYQGEYYFSGERHQIKPLTDSKVETTGYYQWENFANYNVTLAEHNIGAMIGMSFSEKKYNFANTGGEGLLKDVPSYAYPNYLSSNATSLITKGDESLTRKLSYYGRLSYDYASKYMLQFTLRADAADLSILPNAQRWGYFPAVSTGWQLSNEKWFPKQSVFSFAKLRASWGQNGSISGLGNFSYANAIVTGNNYPFTPNGPNYTIGSKPSSTGNDQLKWETSEQLNFGFDTRFFKDRLSFSMDYFIKKTRDLIVLGSTPTLTVGNAVSPANVGDVENKGFEFELGWKDNIGDFKYSINANLATLDNKVTFLDPTITRIDGMKINNNTLTAFEEGYPVWYFRGYKVDHIDRETGNPIYVSKDGTPTESPVAEDQQMIGSAIPDFTYGVSVNLSYKNFDLAVFGQGSQGNEIAGCFIRNDRRTINRLECYYTDAWTPEHQDAKYARIDFINPKYWQSSAIIFDGSYFRIKQIQLGYTFPKHLLSKVGISNLRLYGSLDDFFTFTKYPGLDPEASAGTTRTLGLDFGSFPSSKKIVLGLNLTF